MKHKLHNPLGLILPWLFGALAFFGYLFYWNMLAHKIKTIFSSHKGHEIEYSNIKAEGFPFRQTIIINDFDMGVLNGKFKTSEISFTTNPFSPRLWVLSGMKLPVFINSSGEKFDISSNDFKLSIRANVKDASLKIARISLESQDILFKSLENNYKISGIKTHILGVDEENSYAFSIEAQGLGAFEYFKAKNLDPNIMRGLIINAKAFEDGFYNWQKNGGAIEIKYGQIGLSGYGPIEYGVIDKLTGKINPNTNGKFVGNLEGDVTLTVFSDKKISFDDMKIEIEDNDINVEKTLKSLDLSKFLIQFSK